MTQDVKKLDDLNEFIDRLGTEEQPFGEAEEEGIISLAIEAPEFYRTVYKYLKQDYFTKFNTKFLITIINSFIEEKGVIPTRELLRDDAIRNLSSDDDYQSVLDLIDRRPTPRETPIIKDRIIKWARARAFGMLYSEEGLRAYEAEDFDSIDKLFTEAKNITDITRRGVWFFDEIESLFHEEIEVHLTSGFSKLDKHLNLGGPTKKDVLCWMAPTGVGKSLVLVNSGLALLRLGLNVMHITCEMSEFKTRLRYCGVISNVKISKRIKHKELIRDKINKFKATHNGSLYVEEYPPDEISVDQIYQSIDNLANTRNWKPDIVIIDYLELLISRHKHDNRDDYVRQKSVATQIRGLAKNTETLVLTATQTNRDTGKKKKGEETTEAITVNRAAESYGKMLPLDYVISINQSEEEYKSDPPKLRLYIAKNRNGPKFHTVMATVDYDTMIMTQTEIQKFL